MCIAIDEMCTDTRTEGRTEERLEMAMRMLKNEAFSYEQISEVTLLFVEELKTLEEKEI